MINIAEVTAFPSHGSMGEVVSGGMTLLDYFAAKAMQGYVSSIGVVAGHSPSDADIARYSYDTAAAMIEARKAYMESGE